MEHLEKLERQREYIDKEMSSYTPAQRQEVFSRLPVIRLEDDELVEFVAEKKKEFNNRASDAELDEAMKHFRL